MFQTINHSKQKTTISNDLDENGWIKFSYDFKSELEANILLALPQG